MKNLLNITTGFLDKILNPIKLPIISIFLSIGVYHLSGFGIMGDQLIPKIPYITYFTDIGSSIKDLSPMFSFLGNKTDIMLNYICTYAPIIFFMFLFKNFGLKIILAPFRFIKRIFTVKPKKESNADFLKRSADYKYQVKDKKVKKTKRSFSFPKINLSSLFERKAAVAAHAIPFDPNARNYLLKNFIVKDMKRWNEMPDY